MQRRNNRGRNAPQPPKTEKLKPIVKVSQKIRNPKKFIAGQGSDRIEFIGGAAKFSDIERLMLDQTPRLAFAGRSNVGKSSLLNSLTGAKLARVSAEPGKTREMNFYKWKTWILVDLPGYGFAKVSKALRDDWGKEIATWITGDELIAVVVVLVDGRHGYQKLDMELVAFLQDAETPYVVAFTKMDKYKSVSQRKTAEGLYAKASEDLNVTNFVFVSSQSRDGIAPLGAVLKDLSNQL